MIDVNFRLSNPFCKRWVTVFYKEKILANNKSAEIQVVKDATVIIFGFRFSTRCDHAGVNLDIGLFGYSVMVSYNDTRHWNSKANRYYVYDDRGNAT